MKESKKRRRRKKAITSYFELTFWTESERRRNSWASLLCKEWKETLEVTQFPCRTPRDDSKLSISNFQVWVEAILINFTEEASWKLFVEVIFNLITDFKIDLNSSTYNLNWTNFEEFLNNR